ncbi:MAG: response regulator transcription factor [Treponema sp.]|nr:response regulator transcription factor [Treponema sp.]
MIKILVLEDDAGLNLTVSSYLRKNGYEVVSCQHANDAYNEMYNTLFDLIISDVMLPQIDGFEFAETVRKINQNIPIIFMTARDDFSSKQKGFAAGIDDYLVKPVDLDELLLRISAILRRSNIAQSKKITVGSLTLDADAVSAISDGQEIQLTAREFNLIYKLLSYPNKTFTRVQLMDEFWDADSNATPRAVDVYITKIREKLAQANTSGFEIATVHGLGYKAVIK